MFGRRRKIKVTILSPFTQGPPAWVRRGDELVVTTRTDIASPAGTRGYVEIPVRLRFG